MTTRRSADRREVAAGVLLVVAAVVALAWANSAWSGGYESLWHTGVDLRPGSVGSVGFDGDLRHLVNEGLMAVFFLVVGMEIKRELVAGELREWRTAALPAICALGGMVVPALVYLAVVGVHGPLARGWGIPMATDIAFAVGVVALLGRRVPPSLRLFLLTLAVVDDIGAIVVIAVVYSSGISVPALLVGFGVLALMVGLDRSGRSGRAWLAVQVVLGLAVWLAFYESGVHATVAGALLGLVAPVAVVTRLEPRLRPVTNLAVVPVFALANAGVALAGVGASSRVAVGVGVGLVVGKLLGISGTAWLAVRLRLGTLPRGSTWGQMVGIAGVAGIGFTVSLFVAGLAFPGTDPEGAAKVGVLAASVLASGLGVGLLLASSARTRG